MARYASHGKPYGKEAGSLYAAKVAYGLSFKAATVLSNSAVTAFR